MRILMERSLVHITPTWTDRPRRSGEQEAEHRFVSAAEMSELTSNDGFIEVVKPFGLPYRYGLPILEPANAQAAAVMIRAPFVEMFLAHYPKAKVYQIEADFAFAQREVLARGTDELGTRLSDFDAEIMTGRQHANRIFYNQGDGLELLVTAITAAMIKDKLLKPKLHAL
jgi:guanylate kinase